MERLSGLDATFLYVETKAMHMQVSLLAILDPSEAPGGYDHARLYARLERLAHATPKLRRRLLTIPLGLHHPMWVEDPLFDPMHHLKRIDCPAPGGLRELADLCGRIHSTPLDRARPLWEIWVIEGVERGHVALLAKVHHAVADGMTAASLLGSLFSMGRDQADVPPVPPQRATAGEPTPTELELLRDAFLDRLGSTKQLSQVYRRTLDALSAVKERRRAHGSHAGATPVLDVPRTVFNAPITAQRSAALSRVSLDDVRRIRKAFSVTVNDVVLALCAGAVRRYLERRGQLPLAPLIAACPVAVRDAAALSRGSNHVSAMFTSLATNLEDPVERLLAIRGTARDAKEEHDAFGAATLGAWAELTSPAVFTAGIWMYSRFRLSNAHRPFHNVMISNVPGPPLPLFVDGAKLIAAYPMGPVMEGAGLNITVMSYVDQVDFGFLAATNLVPDVEDLADGIPPALAELLARISAA